MSGMGRDAHGHPSGGGGGGERPHQLRRPADPAMDELSKRMDKMDAYGSDYGRFPYNPQLGQQQQHPMSHPPRPAPNADGWSSGENNIGPGGQPYYQHHGGFDRLPPQPSWNPTASEFVPKSNLSAAAREFVPRQMPRNTSWAYQQQHQQEQQPSQELVYQQEPPPADYGYQQRSLPPASSNHGGGGGARSHPAPRDCMYDPTEALTDAVATLVLMPHKFERTSMQLAEKINNTVSDPNSLKNLANLLVDTCLERKDFQSMAGKFCNDLARNVTLAFDGVTFKHQLLEKYQGLHGEHVQLLSSNAKRCRSLLVFATDLYLRLQDSAEASATEAAGVDPASRVRSQLLANLVYQLFMSFLTLGKQDESNLLMVADMLKLSGESLEGDEVRFKGSAENMDQVMELIRSIAGEDKVAEKARCAFSRVVEMRAAGWKGMTEAERPTTFDIPESNKPSGRTKGSNAIAIIQPPPPTSQPHQQPRNNRNSYKGGGTSTGKVASSSSSGRLPKEEQELTEEELRFMSEQMGEDNLSESDGTSGLDIDGNGASDAGSDMPEEVEAAYQEFLDEQRRQQQGGAANGK